tara:strand:- start:1875 stop:2060 length:186 start_codon:yes stop_codon:yes gene_type:complete
MVSFDTVKKGEDRARKIQALRAQRAELQNKLLSETDQSKKADLARRIGEYDRQIRILGGKP